MDTSGIDRSFLPEPGLDRAVELLRETLADPADLPERLPEQGIGEVATLDWLAPHALGRAARLDRPDVLAHMDPPTPWITWAIALWNARLNQNLLHPETSPFAMEAEQRVITWLKPFFGMGGGHLCSGSTLANLTALWAAREARGIRKVVASEAAHLSIPKAANILGLAYESVPADAAGQLDPAYLSDLKATCLVLTAGTTAAGAIDPLTLAGQAAWTHVDAAWAGPLRLSPTHASLLAGLEAADSVAISGHKWLFQPKESALVLFREPEVAHPAISATGSYLTTPNIGLQGSRGAAALPLLATAIAWGRAGIVARIDRAMAIAAELAAAIEQEDGLELWRQPRTGIVLFRPVAGRPEALYERLPAGMLSQCRLAELDWLRSVAANPLARVEVLLAALRQALRPNLES